MQLTEQGRYDRIAIALHWAIGAALIAQIAFGFSLDSIAPRGTPARSDLVNLHKSCGLVLGVLIMLRLAWRMAHRPPGLPATMRGWQRRAAAWSHRGLYACMVAMPLSGYIASNFSKHGLRFFGTPLAPWGPDLPAVYGICNGIHIATAFVLVTLIALHVAAALKHALVDHDGVMQRMLPAASSLPRSPDITTKARP